MSKIELFDTKKIGITPIIAIIASKGSGKSFLCRDLISKLSYYPSIVVICPSDITSKYYNSFLPDSYIHYEFNNKIIGDIIDRQKKIISKAVDPKNKDKKIDPRLLLVLDDVQGENDLCKPGPFMDIFLKGRHSAITLIIIIQSAMALKPDQRSAIDYCFFLGKINTDTMKKVYKYYCNGNICDDFKDFKKLYEKATDDRNSLVICNSDIKGAYFYKATEITGKVNIGNKQFNSFHKLKYRKNWEEENKSKFIRLN